MAIQGVIKNLSVAPFWSRKLLKLFQKNFQKKLNLKIVMNFVFLLHIVKRNLKKLIIKTQNI